MADIGFIHHIGNRLQGQEEKMEVMRGNMKPKQQRPSKRLTDNA
ncbi:hypothetical protein ACLBWT_07255 [Paenibacillus sp. D51F]